MRLTHLSARTSTFPSLCAHWVGTELIVLAGGGGADRSGRENRIELLLAESLKEVANEVLDGEPVFFLAPAMHSERFFVAVRMTSVAIYEIAKVECSHSEISDFVLRRRTDWESVPGGARVTAIYGCSDYLAFCTTDEKSQQNTLHIWCYFCSCLPKGEADPTVCNAISFIILPSISLPLESASIFVVPRICEKQTELIVVSRHGEVCQLIPREIPHILKASKLHNEHPFSSLQPTCQADSVVYILKNERPQLNLAKSIGELRALYPLHLEPGHSLFGHFIGHFTSRRSCSLCLLDQDLNLIKHCQVSSTLSCGISRFSTEAAVIFMILSDGRVLAFDSLSLKRLGIYRGKEDSLLTAFELSTGGSRCIVVSPAGVEVCSLQLAGHSLQKTYQAAFIIAVILAFVLSIGIYYRCIENTNKSTNLPFLNLLLSKLQHNALKTNGTGHFKL